MFDADEDKKKPSGFKSLESMSIAEIEDYIGELKAEIVKAEDDIKNKQATAAAADSFFKT